MKLWLLKPVQGLLEKEDPWKPWYDKAFGFVVRAEDEIHARLLAHEQGGYENSPHSYGDEPRNPWLDARLSTCIILTAKGESSVIIRDFYAA